MNKEGLEKLRAPLQPDEIEWKVQGYTKDKSKTIVVPYIDNRAVQNRFDEAFGPENWSCEFREVNGGFICRITVEGVYKEDGASLTNIEPVKGGISDSMKRASTQWGLGRELYGYPKVYITGQQYYIPSEILARLEKMTIAINDGKFTEKVVTF